jgi:hypothetical protein
MYFNNFLGNYSEIFAEEGLSTCLTTNTLTSRSLYAYNAYSQGNGDPWPLHV